ncbi:MAG: polysaccharide deacetylase family protein [Candidatus Omnitrophica bacterium]|nr:polysaccharide deacetylase family protein [Candidatus Omnitrophota bacterium]
MLRKIKLGVFLVLIFAAVLTVSAFLHDKYALPIMMYHSVNPRSIPGMNLLIVKPETFERQMQFLKNHRYNVVRLDDAAAMIRDKKCIPFRTVAITFDDGYKDNYIYAFPILKKYGLPATIFIIINEVSKPNRLSWKEIEEMQASGLITFGSHTLSSTPLIDYKSDIEVKRQIVESKKILEEKLGRHISAFSYPEGRFNDKVKQIVIDAGYELAVATSPGRKHPANDIYLLKRLRISENAENLFVLWFETTGFYKYLKEK